MLTLPGKLNFCWKQRKQRHDKNLILNTSSFFYCGIITCMFNSSCFFFSLQTVNRISEQLEPPYRLDVVLIFSGIIFYIASTSLNKQLKFLGATTGFASHKRKSEKQAQKLHTEDVPYLIWLVTHYPGGGYSRKFRIGVCREGSWTLTLFKAQSRKMTPYSTAIKPLLQNHFVYT